MQPDVLVREPVEFAGPPAGERCGVPLATFDLSFPIDLETMVNRFDLEDGTPLERLRDHLGLPPTADRDWFLGDLVITTLPDSYRGDTPVREQHVLIRPHVVGVVDDAPVPDWVEQLRDAVYVTLGTIFPRRFPAVLNVAAAGAAMAGRPTVVTYGASADLDALDLPDTQNVYVCEYVPQPGARPVRCRRHPRRHGDDPGRSCARRARRRDPHGHRTVQTGGLHAHGPTTPPRRARHVRLRNPPHPDLNEA